MSNENDVDLYDELRKTLESSDETEVEESSEASDQEPTPEDKAEEIVEDESEELSDDDISKLSPRAQKRIREQAAEIKRLSELSNVDKEDNKTDSHQFSNVKDFLEAVQDEDSRKLLETFYGVIKGEMSSTLAPLEQKNNEIKFESEFKKYEGIEGLSDYKNDIKKTFLRNPKQSLKALVGEVVTDLHMNKVKPIEKSPSSPNRDKVDTSKLSKDELYDMLEGMRG